MIRNITIATGGFLYTGDYLHSWLAATQYIAPLMANFDTTITEDSVIKYSGNGEHCQHRLKAGGILQLMVMIGLSCGLGSRFMSGPKR